MTAALSGQDYNYEHFRPEEYNFDHFDGLSVGDAFVDASLTTLNGDKVRLSDFLGKPLVLETGSMTCPMYAQSARPMQKYVKQFPNINFVVLYVREAHPGERIPAHKSLSEKIAAAKKTSRAHGEHRIVLVDDVDGAAHRHYGSMPNSIYIIGSDGKILFRSIWNNTKQIRGILEKISARQKHETFEMHPIPPFGFGGVRTLFLGGVVAFLDFLKGLPRLLAMHKRAGNL